MGGGNGTGRNIKTSSFPDLSRISTHTHARARAAPRAARFPHTCTCTRSMQMRARELRARSTTDVLEPTLMWRRKESIFKWRRPRYDRTTSASGRKRWSANLHRKPVQTALPAPTRRPRCKSSRARPLTLVRVSRSGLRAR